MGNYVWICEPQSVQRTKPIDFPTFITVVASVFTILVSIKQLSR